MATARESLHAVVVWSGMALRTVVVLAVFFVGSCAGRREYHPGDNPHCSVPSCCGGGWFFDGVRCRELALPYCGCSCKGPTPPVYGTQEQCLAEHPSPFWHTQGVLLK